MTHIVLLAATLAAAQTGQPDRPATTSREPMTLVGCLATKPGHTGDYTFTNAADGNKFRLTGKDSRKYAGRKIEVVENTSRGLRFKLGLYPSPNVAAQAGAMDPVQAAIATQPGGGYAAGTGPDLPELRVSRVRLVTGSCQ